MNTSTKRRGLLAGATAAIATVALALGGGVSAIAAPVVTATTGNLHIVKLSMPDTAPQPANGQPSSNPTGAVPIQGVTFTAVKIDTVGGNPVNLATNAGWSLAATLSVDPSGAVTSTGGAVVTNSTVHSGTTDANGVPQASGSPAFQSLPIGVYLVQEISTPAGVTASAPFLVTLPMTNPTNHTEWLYDVYVYPKNSDVAITKSVVDTTKAQAGTAAASVSWTIKADVPRIEGATAGTWAQPTGFVISDAIDSRLSVQNVTVKAVTSAGVEITTPATGGLVAADYAVTPSPFPATGGNLQVTFTAQGLAKLTLLASTNGNQIEVTVGTRVVANIGDGNITNAASVTVNGGTPLVSVAEETLWGNALFTKKNGSNVPLAGAIFEVYGTKTDADAQTNSLLAAPVTSGADGAVAINGLPLSDHVNGASLGVNYAGYRVYWLVETTAPNGYELLAEPIPFVLVSDGSGGFDVKNVTVDTNGVATGVGAEITDVVNVPANGGFVLPLTGGTGTLWLTVGGLALLAVVLLFVVLRRRREHAAE